mmetsp:Transcript_22683/g.35498  ORF Transcript_22683/g.35498 Transcript_22683/m.35498 type:complete len:231 (+) Transcript_22683:283-975(+)|eukprot:CAMPEP_0184312510 /NCGR_PEP_ID=MMETSP1049-20130417/50634_1 /TAXON_ID=77928 /ORGANISM="Proteomonas sulcata, Strain CCMP704" /LENGTH=230 /DNA_ID=CAMNT_0026628731 /DNA_START=264 /DNA_END=956 /DNA_ORIENTATION=-
MADMEAMMQARLEQHLMNVAETIESQIDMENKKLDELDEDDLERIREKRIAQMRKEQEKKQEWRQKGHGQYQELSNEKEFFEAAKGSEHMVCHFYRSATHRCNIVDKHLSLIAQKHIEARFVKIDAEKCPFLAERLRIVVLPTIALVRQGKTVDYIVGFDDLGGQDDFQTPVLEWRIACQGIIKVDYDVHEGPPGGSELNPRAGRKMVQARKGIWQSNANSDSEEDDFDD